MKFYLERATSAIRPASRDDAERIATVPYGEIFACNYRKDRNARLFRKFQALLNMIADNHPKYDNRDAVKLALKIRCGHYKEHITADGEVVFVPISLSFDETESAEFEVFYKRALQVASTEFVHDMPPERLDQYLERISTFAD